MLSKDVRGMRRHRGFTVEKESMTRTLAKLQVSKATYNEIETLLRAADYDHLFLEDGLIDLQGIGLTAEVQVNKPFETRDFISPQDAHVAVVLYNDIRTSLEGGGWTISDDTTTPGYWWVHPDHTRAHSMSAAHGQWRLDLESKKLRRSQDE